MDRERYEYFIDEYDEFDWYIIDNTKDEKYEYLEEITKILNQQHRTITDLEAKLAESEKKREEIDFSFDMETTSNKEETEKLFKTIDQLKQQLAENERKYEVLYKLFSEQHEIIDQYELECFEEVNRLLKEQKDFYVVEKDEYDKMVSGAKQFAKETAIAKLEKVKVKLNEEINNASVLLDPVEYEDYHELLGVIRGHKLSVDQIDQQIKSLKGEK